METPLLPAEGDESTPSLSSGPAVAEESEFSRLIAQTNPLSALAHRFDPFATQAPRRAITTTTATTTTTTRGPFLIIAAGTLSLFHIGFVWGSYISDSWAETHLYVLIGWQKQYLPALDDFTDSVIRTTTLASLLQDLLSAKQYLLMGILWVVALFLPCAFMILSPTWIITDYNERALSLETRMRTWSGRIFLELSMRFSFTVLYVFILVDLGTSFIELHWTDTTVQVKHKILGGLAAYVVGITSAVLTISTLRSPPQQNKPTDVSDMPLRTEFATLRSPPPQAFQHPWRPSSSSAADGPPPPEPHMTVLEETHESPPQAPAHHVPSGDTTPDLIDEDSAIVQQQQQQQPRLSYRQRVLVFQTGLIAVVLWIPSLYLPIIAFSYSGLATEFMAERTIEIFLWQIPSLLWSHGVEAQTARWILVLLGVVVLSFLVIIPVLATCLGILTWLGEGNWSTRSRYWLFCVHPLLNGPVFAVTVVAAMHAMEPLTTYLFQEQQQQSSEGLCQKFAQTLGEDCLSLAGRLLPGAWCYLVQSFVLEAFIVMTLFWSSL